MTTEPTDTDSPDAGVAPPQTATPTPPAATPPQAPGPAPYGAPYPAPAYAPPAPSTVPVKRGWVIAGVVVGALFLLLVGFVVGVGTRGAHDRGFDDGHHGPGAACIGSNATQGGSVRVCGMFHSGANPGGPDVSGGQGAQSNTGTPSSSSGSNSSGSSSGSSAPGRVVPGLGSAAGTGSSGSSPVPSGIAGGAGGSGSQ
jgi:hypothetical protein